MKKLHNNIVVVFCTKMSYNYEKVSLSGNKNDQVIHHFRIIHQVAKSQVYLIQESLSIRE